MRARPLSRSGPGRTLRAWLMMATILIGVYVALGPRVGAIIAVLGGRCAERRPIVATAEAVSADDVALELVATKMALQQIIWTVGGSTSEPDGFAEWVHRSPVPLPQLADMPSGWYEEDFAERLMARADEIEVEMMAAAGTWLLGHVRDRRDA
jgi:hypothetical protein